MMEQIARLNKNSVEGIAKLNEVVSSKDSSITFRQLNDDGSRTEYQMPTIGKMKEEIEAINNNMKRMAGMEGQTYILDGETSKKVYTVDLSREPSEIDDIGSITTFNRKQNWFFESLMNPLISVKLDLTNKIDDNTNKILSARYIVKFERNEDGTLTANGQTALEDFTNRFLGSTSIRRREFLNWYTNPTNTGVIDNRNPERNLDEEIFDLNYKRLNFKGTFSVVRVETDDINNKIWYHFNTLNFEGRDGTSRTLKIGDSVILKKQGASSKYKIREISTENQLFKVRLERIEGYDPIPVGESVLEYYSPFVANTSVDISIGYDEYNVIFVKPINTENNIEGSLWSLGTSFFTNDLLLDTDQNISFSEFYNETVRDYGALLKDLVTRQIPTKYGIVPNTVELDEENFKVVQINKHITDNTNSANIRRLHKEKSEVKSKIEANQQALIEKNKELNTTQFQSTAERAAVMEDLEEIKNRLDNNISEYSSISQEITNSTATGDLNEQPKFRLRGFFPFPEPQEGQEAIQFRIQYRYSSIDGDVNTVEGFETEEGQGYFSNWNEVMTEVRQRVYDIETDSWIWMDENISDAEVTNINQVDIPIRNGERVEFRIKAISEVGWPDSKLESDWSEIIVKDFPDEFENLFRLSDFILEESIKDNAVIEMRNNLEARGVYRHVLDQYSLNEEFYAHKDENIITSFSDDQGNFIDLYNYLRSLESRISSVEAELNRTKGELVVMLFKDGESWTLENDATKNIVVEAEEYGEGNRSARVYDNNIYVINNYYIRLENLSETNPLGLLSDRKYFLDDEKGDPTNLVDGEQPFITHGDTNKAVIVDENNEMHKQQNNQFIWFSDDVTGNAIYSGWTKTLETVEILSSDNFNISFKTPDTLMPENILNQGIFNWSGGTPTDFPVTVYPMISDPSQLVESGQDKLKILDESGALNIPINIYFRFNAAQTTQFTADRTKTKLTDKDEKSRYLKLFLEREGESRPQQYTIKFIIKRQKTATYTSTNSRVRQLIRPSRTQRPLSKLRPKRIISTLRNRRIRR
jgi:hypothetical protein